MIHSIKNGDNVIAEVETFYQDGGHLDLVTTVNIQKYSEQLLVKVIRDDDHAVKEFIGNFDNISSLRGRLHGYMIPNNKGATMDDLNEWVSDHLKEIANKYDNFYYLAD